MSVAKAPFAKMSGLQLKPKPLRIMVLGQGGVGKSALVVRFITRRYIGEYDPTLEKLYTFHTLIDGEMANLEILDTAGQPHESECPTLEANIRWAEAFILMYSVTDKCSFDECNRLKFLINYNKRRRRLTSKSQVESPVVLVGNKSDQCGDRMVTLEEGSRRSVDIGCASEIPAHLTNFNPSSSVDNNNIRPTTSGQSTRTSHFRRRWTEVGAEELEREEEEEERRDCLLPFRGRASTDGTLLVTRPRRRWRYPSPGPPADQLADRRMSISMRGTSNNAAF
ncbi:hypothetical protein B566_EDAN010149 [Ephemera danica]|nr:hypothetical protein B566_EDAN010149 [Ephemera danica]